MSPNILILSGGFDPVHEGHIAMFREAKNKYDTVIVGLNSDDWLARKKASLLCLTSVVRQYLNLLNI